ncbi:MAG: DUF2887 domain-containing protein, partial [Oscillatoriales cyanobacterium SM2_1_8]|nr:DUF2887 domain-containing protein [Oscillatoriales cyanobacterium SM2_1_8]
YQPQVAAGWLHRVYLEEWVPEETSWGGVLLQLVVVPEAEVKARVRVLQQQTQGMETALRERVL